MANNNQEGKVDLSFIMTFANVDEGEASKRVEDTVKAVEASHHVYQCIAGRRFASPRIQQHPAYSKVKGLLANNDCRFLELGCCFGTDVRKLIQDGLSPSRLVVSDLHGDYWKIGLEVLFRDSLSLPCVWADLVDPLTDVTKIPQFSQPFSVVSAQAMLHVFAKQQSRTFLTIVHTLLKPGGILTGSTAMSGGDSGFEWRETPTVGLPDRKAQPRYLYSKSELFNLFQELGYENVEIELRERTQANQQPNEQPTSHACFIAYKKK